MCVNPKRVSVYQILPGTVKKKILANVQFTGDERLLAVVLHVNVLEKTKDQLL
jgi:NADP-dependent 3-hydroxy acid dehydrogenase YdfG